MSWEDPIVKETRARRGVYAEKFGYDLNAIFEDIRQRQGRDGREVVVREPRHPEPKRHVA